MSGSPACPRLLDRDWLGSLDGEVETGDPEKGLAQGTMGEQEASCQHQGRVCHFHHTEGHSVHPFKEPSNPKKSDHRKVLIVAERELPSLWILEQPPLGTRGVPSW